MNTLDSIEHNEALVIIWNHIEEKADDEGVRLYAKNKRKQLSELLVAKKLSDKNKKNFDRQYMLLIEKEIREVQKYDKARKKYGNSNTNTYSNFYTCNSNTTSNSR